MTAEISDIIKKIKSEFIESNNKFRIELDKNKLLSTEISALKSALDEKKKQNELLEDKISNLEKEIELLISKTNSTNLNQENYFEIDLLVREIDHCIQKLKKN